MQDLYNYKKFAVLYVDDEEKSLKLFARAFSDTFRILTAANARDGLDLLQKHKNEPDDRPDRRQGKDGNQVMTQRVPDRPAKGQISLPGLAHKAKQNIAGKQSG